VLKEVESYLTTNRESSFKKLHERLLVACNFAKNQLGINVISRVYARSDKQSGDILKAKLKIASKITKNRNKGRDYHPKDVNDIIGATIVVQYPDQVDSVIKVITEKLLEEKIENLASERIQVDGYYATHVDFISKNVDHDGLLCELQIKTMLHDAWSSKMHDLNYKPSGRIDARLDNMMRVVANSLESIEVQSETLRDLISERWKIEDAWRVSARRRMFEKVPPWIFSSESDDDEARKLKTYIEAESEALANAETDSKKLADVVDRITSLKSRSMRHGWILAAYLGNLRRDQRHIEFALRAIEDWISEAQILTGRGDVELNEFEIWSAPLACFSVGDSEQAIQFSKKILSSFTELSEESKCILRINLANFMTEQEYFLPSPSAKRDGVKAEIENLIAGCCKIEAEDPSLFHDLRGMLIVSFSTDPAEIRAAINLIDRGLSEAPTEEAGIAQAYHELHSRLAWRRLLEVEDGKLLG